MTDKLDWNWDSSHDCEVAFHNGYMIKAERDDSPENPFEAWDGNWPIAIYYDRDIKTYEKTGGAAIDAPLNRFTDGQLIHDQIAIAAVFDFAGDANGRNPIERIMECYVTEEPVRYCRDADVLRDTFDQAFSDVSESKRLETCAALYGLLNIACHQGTSRGYCQGDWAEVLVVATPEAIAEFRPGVTPEELEKDLEGTFNLYGWWAWGDVYGYTLWAPEFDEDGEVSDWVQLDDSCWGFYGDDHAKSGLEEGALGALPDEPVRVPDTQREAA